MPYLLPRSFLSARKLIAILAFGRLSYLEICTIFSDKIKNAEMINKRAALLELYVENSIKIERLAGIYKLVAPIGELTSEFNFNIFREEIRNIFEYFKETANFSLSFYNQESNSKMEYEALLSNLLSVVRELGFRKANLLRPRNSLEIQVRDIISRQAIDFVLLNSSKNHLFGITLYTPNIAEIHERATKRPILNPKISLSPRLAKLLVNLAGLLPNEVLLDPFCGSGTILCEAILEGINCIGIDKDKQRINNARRNLTWTINTTSKKVGSFSLMTENVKNLMNVLEGKKVDAIVTEPILLPTLNSTPSLEKARKMIKNSSKIYSQFLYSSVEVLKKKGKAVIIVPSVRTSEGKNVSIIFEQLKEIGLNDFQPRNDLTFEYPITITPENTRWIRRMVYVFERS
jgi:tRNA G10  N-methylase Trm11